MDVEIHICDIVAWITTRSTIHGLICDVFNNNNGQLHHTLCIVITHAYDLDVLFVCDDCDDECDAAGMDVEPCGIGEEAPIIMRSVAIDARTGRPIGEVI